MDLYITIGHFTVGAIGHFIVGHFIVGQVMFMKFHCRTSYVYEYLHYRPVEIFIFTLGSKVCFTLKLYLSW